MLIMGKKGTEFFTGKSELPVRGDKMLVKQIIGKGVEAGHDRPERYVALVDLR